MLKRAQSSRLPNGHDERIAVQRRSSVWLSPAAIYLLSLLPALQASGAEFSSAQVSPSELPRINVSSTEGLPTRLSSVDALSIEGSQARVDVLLPSRAYADAHAGALAQADTKLPSGGKSSAKDSGLKDSSAKDIGAKDSDAKDSGPHNGSIGGKKPLSSGVKGKAAVAKPLKSNQKAPAGATGAATSAKARNAEPVDGFREPLRITAGDEDQLMPSWDPLHRRLYYASNVSATWQIYVQMFGQNGMPEGGPLPLFALSGDALEPHISPDGETLLFISYRDDARGDACLIEVESLLKALQSNKPSSAASSTGEWLMPPRPEPVCLTDQRTADVQAIWDLSGDSVLVLSRDGLHSDFALQRISLQAVVKSREADPSAPLLSQRTILAQNMVGPSLTPDGKGLMYVPVSRRTDDVGINFARQTNRALAYRVLSASGAAQELQFDLPGVSGFPAIAPDGHFLYFSQYLNDTNGDGQIDGNDNSVLFRAPIPSSKSWPDPATTPEQLTSSDWNCHSPLPTEQRLFMICAHSGSLDLFQLPLDGAIPSDWNFDRLSEEFDASRLTWHKLLVASRLLQSATALPDRIAALQDMIRLHLSLGEYESASFYARQAQTLDATGQYGMSARATTLQELIALLREEHLLSEGRLDANFVRHQQTRLETLADEEKRSPAARALILCTRSLLLNLLGDKALALTTLQQIDVTSLDSVFDIQLLTDLLVGILQGMDRQSDVLSLLQTAALHPLLPPRVQLPYADAYTRLLLQSLPHAARPEVLSKALAKAAPESNLHFMLEIQSALLRLTSETQEPVRQQLFELYKANPGLDRRKALVLATVRAATLTDSDSLLYDFANTWVSGLKRGMSERRYAEQLYRDVILERAYAALRKDNFSDARGFFYGLTLQSDALEAYAGFADARRAEGKSDAIDQLQKRFNTTPDAPQLAYVRAWEQIRALPSLPDEDFDAAAASVSATLSVCELSFAGTAELRLLQGYLSHLKFRRHKAGADALAAGQNYRLALDLAQNQPRAKATLLQLLGMLEMDISSPRAARQTLNTRTGFPLLDVETELAMRVEQARIAWQSDEGLEALQHIRSALKLSDSARAGRFRPLVLNRAAFYAWRAGELEEADQYLTELGTLSSPASAPKSLPAESGKTAARPVATGSTPSAANKANDAPYHETPQQALSRLLLHGVVSQARGEHGRALAYFEAEKGLLDAANGELPVPDLPPTKGTYFFGREAHRLLNDGLRAQSLAALGRWLEAVEVQNGRMEVLAKRFKTDDLDEDLLEIATGHQQLGVWLARAGRTTEALQQLESGWTQAQLWQTRTETPISDVGLALLRTEATLLLSPADNGEHAALRQQMRVRLERVWATLAKVPNPRWAPERFLFPIYLSQL